MCLVGKCTCLFVLFDPNHLNLKHFPPSNSCMTSAPRNLMLRLQTRWPPHTKKTGPPFRLLFVGHTWQVMTPRQANATQTNQHVDTTQSTKPTKHPKVTPCQANTHVENLFFAHAAACVECHNGFHVLPVAFACRIFETWQLRSTCCFCIQKLLEALAVYRAGDTERFPLCANGTAVVCKRGL